ncbi:MAG TPA: APC family permease [Candidatus Limnocylindrales bacterium]|nr:APC family permease [Candidatus Limnocylindrales bacterium]
MIGGRRPLQGRKPGDRRVRVERPHAALFRWTGPGQLTAKEAASAPTTAGGRAYARLKALLLGRPLASEEELGERLSKKKALAIFSSDAISSSAYATEEILRVLILGGLAALAWGLWVSAGIAVLLIAVAISYRQICIAYPTGGGSYSVSKVNFGRRMSLVAASALMIDYILTVAVSTASSIEQVTSAIPELFDLRIVLGVVAIVLITLGNLRGLREAGNLFAIPTYVFIVSALLMIVIGSIRIVIFGEGGGYQAELAEQAGHSIETLSIILLLRAFAAGAVALTGTEAIATGVPAFEPPEAKNAATTLAVMAGLLGVLFVGLTFLAVNFGITHVEEPVKQTVISQIAATVYGAGSIPFFLFQGFTALLLVLAANTSFNAFPRLLAILAIDGHMPRQFSFRGDRLAFSYGIIVLATVAAGLIVLFRGETHLLIPLYAVGVFIDFTISQAGMIRHWRRERPPGWQRRLAINAFGCTLTAIVAVVVTVAKAPQSLIVIALIPLLVGLMTFIHRQYSAQEAELAVRDEFVVPSAHREQRVVIPVNGINRAVVQAVIFGQTLASDVRAVFITEDPDLGDALRVKWERQVPGVPLVIVESPYRALVGPLTAYLDVLDLAWPPDRPAPVTIVVLPEYVARHWWDRLLYNQSAKRLKSALLGREHTVVADVPYRRGQAGRTSPEPDADPPPSTSPPSTPAAPSPLPPPR